VRRRCGSGDRFRPIGAGGGFQTRGIDAERGRGLLDALSDHRQPVGIGRRIRFQIDPGLQRAFRVTLLHLRQRQVISRARRQLGVLEPGLEGFLGGRGDGAAGGQYQRLAPIAENVRALVR
jgi:hypothetical protein